jgi:hypothetical protein
VRPPSSKSRRSSPAIPVDQGLELDRGATVPVPEFPPDERAGPAPDFRHSHHLLRWIGGEHLRGGRSPHPEWPSYPHAPTVRAANLVPLQRQDLDEAVGETPVVLEIGQELEHFILPCVDEAARMDLSPARHGRR